MLSSSIYKLFFPFNSIFPFTIVYVASFLLTLVGMDFKNELNSSSLYFSINASIFGFKYLILSKVYSKSIVL